MRAVLILGSSGFCVQQGSEFAPPRRPSTPLKTGAGRRALRKAQGERHSSAHGESLSNHVNSALRFPSSFDLPQDDPEQCRMGQGGEVLEPRLCGE